jgi:hypothetical protein
MLVLLGATLDGKKQLLSFKVGARESAQSWREFLVDIKPRGLKVPPETAVRRWGFGRCSIKSSRVHDTRDAGFINRPTSCTSSRNRCIRR